MSTVAVESMERLVHLAVEVPLILPSGVLYDTIVVSRSYRLTLPDDATPDEITGQTVTFELTEPAPWPEAPPIKATVAVGLAEIMRTPPVKARGRDPFPGLPTAAAVNQRRRSRPVIVHPPELTEAAVAAAEAPVVHVHVPQQPPPIVNVDVHVPEPAPRRIEIDRDRNGRIDAARVLPAP